MTRPNQRDPLGEAREEAVAWSRDWMRIAGRTFAVAALVVVGVGWWLGHSTRWKSNLLQNGVQARAKVIEIHRGTRRWDDGWVKVRMLDEPGFTEKIRGFGQSRRYSTGQTLEVWYEEARPERIRTQWDASVQLAEGRWSTVFIVALMIALLAGWRLAVATGCRWALSRGPVSCVGLAKASGGAFVAHDGQAFRCRFGPDKPGGGWLAGSGRWRVFVPNSMRRGKGRPWIVARPLRRSTERRLLARTMPR